LRRLAGIVLNIVSPSAKEEAAKNAKYLTARVNCDNQQESAYSTGTILWVTQSLSHPAREVQGFEPILGIQQSIFKSDTASL
jgi:hypothetical protein